MRATCGVYGCLSTSYRSNNGTLRFHQFPKDENRLRKWIKACQRPDLINKTYKTLRHQHVCSLHFEEKMYAKMHLKITAIPTINLPPAERSICTQTDPLKVFVFQDVTSRGVQVSGDLQCKTTNDEDEISLEIYHDRSTQTTSEFGHHNPCEKKIISKNKAKQLKLHSQKISKKQFEAGCDKFLNASLSNIVKAQIYSKRHSKEKRYSAEFKLFALNMYYSSPHCYKFLAKTLGLPSKRTLSSTNIPMTTQVNKQMLDALSTTARHMSPSQKECVVCMDVMSVKRSLAYDSKQDRIVGLHEIDGQQEPYTAGYNYTIMLRGITSKWKQPIGFAFTSSRRIDEKLAYWILNTINKLLEMGFQIRALVSNHGSDFVKFAKSKGISTDQSHFIINGRKIYYIFDVPHIMKCIRNDLIKNNYEYNGRTVSWDDVQTMYNLDIKKDKDMRCVPRLTDAHLIPNKFQRHKVRFAAQVLSNSVVAALETYTASGQIEPSNGTIAFFEMVDNLFDLLNSSHPHSQKPYAKPYRGENFQIELLNKAESFFKNLTVQNKKSGKDVTKTKKFIDALIITMNSIRQLLLDMQNEDFVCLYTRQLNNDCLESFFGLIRHVCGNSREPTCLQFTRAFRKSFFCQLMQLSDGGICMEGIDSFILRFNDFVKNNTLTVNNERIAKKGNVEILKTPCSFDLPAGNPFLYICGYLLRRCAQKHKCLDMVRYASSYSTELSSNVGLQGVPDDFLDFCNKLENSFNNSFVTFVGANIGENIYNHLTQIEYSQPCGCFPLRFLIRLYVRLRINYIVKFNKRESKSSNNKFHIQIRQLNK